MKTLIVAAMMLATTVGHAAEIDYVPRIGETTAEYNARTSGDPAQMEALRERKKQQAIAAAERAARCAERTTTISSRTYGGLLGGSSSDTTYRYIPIC